MGVVEFHGTRSNETKTLILTEGFKASAIAGRFGCGIYFAKYPELALEHGSHLIQSDILMNQVVQMDYIQVLVLLGIPEEEIDSYLLEEVGLPELKDWVLNHGFKGVEISYSETDAELVIYEESIILKTQDTASASMKFPKKNFDLTNEDEWLIHIGTLNPSDKETLSYEGNRLSISTCPDEWQRIAQLGGNWYLCQKESHNFLDFHELSPEAKEKIIDWGIDKGYVEEIEVTHLTFCDEEGDERYFTFETLEEALMEESYTLEDLEGEEDEDIQELKQRLSNHLELIATNAFKERQQCQIPLGLAFDLLTLSYVEDVLNWDGVFWDDCYGTWSAPRAAIVPSKVASWQFKKL